METKSEQISCPNCGAAIDVNQVLSHQLEERLRKEHAAELARERKIIQEQEQKLGTEREALEQSRKEMDAAQKEFAARLDAEVQQKLAAETSAIRAEAKKAAEADQSAAFESMRQELQAKSEQVRELARTKAEIERLNREKEEMKDAMAAEAERRLNETLRSEREKLQRAEAERTEMKIQEERVKQTELQRQVAELQRKLDQGSMQRQGEAQELAIESWLQEHFPLDGIEEIKKGALGGDCIQTVNTRERAGHGTIYYESKRTKSFQPAWIEKFKADIRERRADIGVLVTEVLPSDMDRMGLRDGIWICNFEEFKGLSAVLRQTLIQVSAVAASQENRGTKVEMLYSYLTGVEFRQQLEAIVEGFTQMQTDLDSEKRAFAAQWKKREKQIEKVLLNTTSMYSSIRGIAGNAVQPLRQLEFPGAGELEFEGE